MLEPKPVDHLDARRHEVIVLSCARLARVLRGVRRALRYCCRGRLGHPAHQCAERLEDKRHLIVKVPLRPAQQAAVAHPENDRWRITHVEEDEATAVHEVDVDVVRLLLGGAERQQRRDVVPTETSVHSECRDAGDRVDSVAFHGQRTPVAVRGEPHLAQRRLGC